MAALLIAIAALLVAVAAFVRVVLYLRRSTDPTSSQVVITTTAGDSFRGEARPRLFCVRLEHAEALRASGPPIALGGCLDVSRRSIGLVQRLPEPVEASRLQAVS